MLCRMARWRVLAFLSRTVNLLSNVSISSVLRQMDLKKSAKVVKDAITAEINKEPLARIDYVDVVDFDTITPVDEIKGTTLVAIAVYIGKTRLIDNFIA